MTDDDLARRLAEVERERDENRAAADRYANSGIDTLNRALLAEEALAAARARVAALGEALREAKREHYTCEDCWYSCPKSADGCCDETQGSDCNCGVDAFNAHIDALLADTAPVEDSSDG